MAADDGRNALVSAFFSPANSFFEQDVPSEWVWLFPPLDMLGLVFHFLEEKRKQGHLYKVFLLVPEEVRAPWFRFCSAYKRVTRFRAGSDLFRDFDGLNWRKAPASRVPYMILKSR